MDDFQSLEHLDPKLQVAAFIAGCRQHSCLPQNETHLYLAVISPAKTHPTDIPPPAGADGEKLRENLGQVSLAPRQVIPLANTS